MSVLARLLAGLVAAVLTGVGASTLVAGPANAGCAEISAEQLDTSDVAFAGVVTSRRETGDDLITTVRVDRVFKGDITRRVDVVSPANQVDASMDIEAGGLLIVFGRLESGEVTSSLCRSVAGPDEFSYDPILAELGEGDEPAPGYMKVERERFGLSYEQFRAGRAVLGVLGLTGLAYVAFRAWRARRRTS